MELKYNDGILLEFVPEQSSFERQGPPLVIYGLEEAYSIHVPARIGVAEMLRPGL